MVLSKHEQLLVSFDLARQAHHIKQRQPNQRAPPLVRAPSPDPDYDYYSYNRLVALCECSILYSVS